MLSVSLIDLVFHNPKISYHDKLHGAHKSISPQKHGHYSTLQASTFTSVQAFIIAIELADFKD